MLRGRGGGGSALGQRESQVVEERNCRSEPQEGSLSVGVAFLLRMKQEGLNTCTPRRASFANHSHTHPGPIIKELVAFFLEARRRLEFTEVVKRHSSGCNFAPLRTSHFSIFLPEKGGLPPAQPSVTTAKDGNATRHYLRV